MIKTSSNAEIIQQIRDLFRSATLGKGLNRGLGTIIGGGLGSSAAVFSQTIGIGRVGNSIIIECAKYKEICVTLMR
ncbi:hypothetical protein Fmac_029887 [Flemingia macrophylla]|uniref:Uncharacterized protein n=1 Tax=Flemingia macrophylla TaxID=520843 RepID=A0ABD1LBX3_9FABA